MSIDSPDEQINNSSDEQDNELFDDNNTNSSDSNDEPDIYNNNFINENILLDVYSYLFNFMIQRRSDLIENNYNEEEIIKILKMYLITQSIPLNQINFVFLSPSSIFPVFSVPSFAITKNVFLLTLEP